MRTVQELLNNVSPVDGGPSIPLKVDAKCGPKTKDAIQNFQLRHFGWKLADARVDRDGPTHNRMRLCAMRRTWQNSIFQIRRREKDSEVAPRESPILFDVFDSVNQRWGVYAFSEAKVVPACVFPVPVVFKGSPFPLRVAHKRAVSALSGECAIHNVSYPSVQVPWPGLHTGESAQSHCSFTIFVAGTSDAPSETVYTGARFKLAGGTRYGKFQFIWEKPWKFGP